MGFMVSKMLLYLLLPPSSLLLILLAGFVLLRRHRNLGRALVVAGLILLYGLSVYPVADGLLRPLEARYQPLHEDQVRAEAVVVLGGGSRDLSWVPKEPELAGGSLERLVTGIQLARKHHLPLVMSGGSGDPEPGAVREADVMAGIAMKLGFPAKEIIIENRSRNTWENAEAVQKLLPGKTIVLVTSAFHMERSERMFKKRGLSVIPAPAGYLSQARTGSYFDYLPRASTLEMSSTALAEYISLTWYRMAGKI